MNYIGRNVVVASKSGPIETGPTVLVAMALLYYSTALKQTTDNFQMLECVKHSFRSFQDLDFYLQALSGSKGGRLKKHFAL